MTPMLAKFFPKNINFFHLGFFILTLTIPLKANAVITFNPISGTNYFCVYYPDGKNKISVKQAGTQRIISKSTALKALKAKSLKYTSTRQSLQTAYNNLLNKPVDNTLTPKKIKEIIKIANYLMGKGNLSNSDLSVNKTEQLSIIQSLINTADLGKQNTQNEINAIIKCANNERDIYAAITYEPAVIYAKDETAISRLSLMDDTDVPEFYGSMPETIHMCLKNGDFEYAVDFHRNPCVGFTLSDATNCPYTIPEFTYGHLNSPSYRYFGGSPSPEALENKMSELQTNWGSGTNGRLITKSDDPCFNGQ